MIQRKENLGYNEDGEKLKKAPWQIKIWRDSPRSPCKTPLLNTVHLPLPFLLSALQHWRTDQHRAAPAQKRGGGLQPLSLDALEAAGVMPIADDAFDRRWARAVYDNALTALQARLKSRGREPVFLQLRGLLSGGDTAKYQEIAAALAMSESAVKQAALDLRREFGVTLRDEIRRTVTDESQVDDEIRYLLGLLRS